MPRPKTPLSKAEVTGRTVHDPGRYRHRCEPKGSRKLGAPSRWLSEARVEIWREFAADVPWLMESDRGMVELITVLSERLHSGEITVSEMGQLRLCLSACGATPASRNSISVPEDEDHPLAEFLQ